jgi:2-polyprenyl-6-hydroxyphenyl methylase / 3-demethylubiquinone-9 3-methyltransferase
MNADQTEIDKFSALAHHWWDTSSEFKPLHAINPLRLDWICQHTDLKGKKVLDVGCGGGILTESLAKAGAQAKGIDLSEKALKVADLHSLESGIAVQYEYISAENLAVKEAGQYDVVTCMEMLEHVPNPLSIIQACASLVKPGGKVFFSTLNRNPKSYLLAVIGAEYILRMLPKGTHDYKKFIKPSELNGYLREAGLEMNEIIGLTYNPITEVYALGRDTDVNYLVATTKK